MRRLGLTDDEKFWLRQPEHFFIPVQIALYKKYGKALEATTEALRAWMTEPTRAQWRSLERAAAGAGRGVPIPRPKALMLLDRGLGARGQLLAGSRQRHGPQGGRRAGIPPGALRAASSPEEYMARARSSAAVRRDRRRTRPRHDLSPRRDGRVAHRRRPRRRRPAGPGDRQPALAAPFRRGPGADARRLRPHRRPARPPRAARLAGPRADPRRLAAQANPPADRHERRLSPGDIGATRREGRSPIPTTACSGIAVRSGSRPRRSATRCSPPRAGSAA